METDLKDEINKKEKKDAMKLEETENFEAENAKIAINKKLAQHTIGEMDRLMYRDGKASAKHQDRKGVNGGIAELSKLITMVNKLWNVAGAVIYQQAGFP